ncbi:hypothetical protein BD289DRAFT_142883 [Coniella lustricola]|uniref:Uncharacterized protein n=1 Tax=Coniella lustricola TaxID=2025994 RepID=A0A2T2ZV50_9PEZI|nr:hypothetical protein BD289DRAFT_142883 [Coniella lustricola]
MQFRFPADKTRNHASSSSEAEEKEVSTHPPPPPQLGVRLHGVACCGSGWTGLRPGLACR